MSEIVEEIEGESYAKFLQDYFLKLPKENNNRFTNDLKYSMYSMFTETLGLTQFRYDLERDLIYLDEKGPTEIKDPNYVRKGGLCGRLFKKGEPVYRCKDCCEDLNTFICSVCYASGDHNGHDISIAIHNTRDNFCGCGDPELWKHGVPCGNHDPNYHRLREDMDNLVPKECLRSFEEFLGVVLDFIIQVFEHNSERLFVEHHKDRIAMDEERFLYEFSKIQPNLPEKEYALVVYDHDEHTANEFERYFQEVSGCTQEEAKLHTAEYGEVGRKIVIYSKDLDYLLTKAKFFTIKSFYTTIRSSLIVFYEELAMSIIHYIYLLSTSPDFNEYDDGHHYDAFLSNFSDQLTNYYIKRFTIFKESYDESTSLNKFSKEELNAIQHAQWQSLVDIVAENDGIGSHSDVDPIESPPIKYIESDASDYESIINEDEIEDDGNYHPPKEYLSLEDPSKYTGCLHDINLNDLSPFYDTKKETLYDIQATDYPAFPQTVVRSRIDYFLIIDVMFTRKTRREIHQLFIYSPLISNKLIRELRAPHFFINYPNYLKGSKIRKPQYVQGMLGFTVHFLNRPGIAKLLVDKMNFVPYLTALLSKFFMPIPPDGISAERFSEVRAQFMDTMPIFSFNTPLRTLTQAEFKNKLFSLVLQNLHYLVEQKEVQKILPKNPINVASFLYFLSFFQGMNSTTRSKDQHVEYENDNYLLAFEISFYIYRIMRPFCSAYRYSVVDLAKAIRRTIYKIDYWINRGGEKSNGDAIGGVYCVKFNSIPNTNYSLVNFKVEDGEHVSFHYTLHWLLSLLLHNVDQLDEKELKMIGFENLKHLLIGVKPNHPLYFINFQKLQAIFDFPIRSIVLSSQIRANVWVRNGQSIRAMCYSYRDMTDSLFYLDLFILQHMLVLFPPELALQTLLDRFGISGMLVFDFQHETYDENQFKDILLDFSGILIYCLTERGKLINQSSQQELRREILHNTIKPINFNELDRQIPDRLLEECNLEQVFEEICDYKAPESQKDCGIFSLKKEYYNQVNPYYFVNNRNVHDHVEQLLKENIKEQPFYLIPKLQKIEKGPFSLFGDILHERLMSKVIFSGLYSTLYIFKSQAILENFLYFISIAAQDENSSNVVKDIYLLPVYEPKGIWKYVNEIEQDTPMIDSPSGSRPNNTIIDLLFRIIESNEFESSKPKVWYTLSLIEKYSGQKAQQKIQQFRNNHNHVEKVESKDIEYEKRKAEAKARLAKVRQQFTSQQNNFMQLQKELYDDVTLDGNENNNQNNEDTILQSEIPYVTGNCLICAEPGSINSPYGILAYIQPSKLLSVFNFDDLNLSSTIKLEDKGIALFNKSNIENESQFAQKFNTENSPQYPPNSNNTLYGNHITSCGHLLHLKCMSEHYKQLELKLNSNPARCHVESLNLREIVCPLCKTIANTLLPVQGNLAKKHRLIQANLPSLNEWDNTFFNAFEQCRNMFNQAYPQQTISNQDACSNPISSSYANKSINNNLSNIPISVPFKGKLDAGLNEPLSLVGNPFPFTALQSRRRATVLSPSRTGSLINDYMEYITKRLDLNNGDPIKNEQYKQFFNLEETTKLINYNLQMDLEFVNGIFNFLDIFRICYAQRAQLPNYSIAWREYYECNNLLDPVIATFMYTITFTEISDRTISPTALMLESNFINDRIPAITKNILLGMWNSILQMYQLAGNNVETYLFSKVIKYLAMVDGNSNQSILKCDPFAILVEFSLTIVPKLKLDVRYLVRFLLLVTIVKLMVGVIESSLSVYNDNVDYELNLPMPDSFIKMFQLIANSLGLQQEKFNQLWQYKGIKYSYNFIYKSILTFLRKVIIFLDATQIPFNNLDSIEDVDELTQLLFSLELDDLDTIITQCYNTGYYTNFIIKNCNLYSDNHNSTLFIEYPYPYKMVDLPNEFYSLFTTCRKIKCNKCNKTPTNPGICLICSIVICMQSDCCRTTEEGEANQHRKLCSGTIGLFFLISSNTFVFFHHSKGSFFLSPYVDKHGEADVELRRGYPLHLVNKRYDFYLKLYLNHHIHQTVGRKLEANVDNGGWETL